jgi:hypothetical protein
MNLQLAQEDNTALKEVDSQEGKAKKIVQQKVDEMEKQINVAFQAIPDNAKLARASLEEEIKKIAQDMEQYKEKIKELEKRAVPTTPLEVRVQIDQDATTFAENITQSIHRVTELLEKSTQLWTRLLEDGSLQELHGDEDKLHATMAEIK